MGGVASKGDNNNTPLLNLCKERKDLIKAARDARDDLAKSHLLYFRSLLDFSKSLNQFVHEDLIVIPYSSDDDSSCCVSDLASDADSDTECLVCDRSQTGSLSNKCENKVEQGSAPQVVPLSEDKQTCDSSNKKNDLGLFEKEFMSAPVDEVVRVPDQNSSYVKQSNFPDILGLYDAPYDTECGFTEPEQKDEVESDVWREVREKEGIPDLESDSDHHSLVSKNQKKKKNGKVSSSSLASAAREVDKKDMKFSNNIQESSSVDKSSVKADTSDAKVVSEGEETPENVSEVRRLHEEVCDEAYDSSSSSSESSGPGLTDIRSIVEKINGICQKVVSINSEVSKMLEVSKVILHQHLPLGDQFKGFASRVLGNTSGNSTRTLLSMRGLREENSLSMTLEKLYTWEKKLYAEVIVEERLRILYEKGYEILKNLDQTGAESSKIYEAENACKFHSSNIKVSLKTVESVSMRIHNIRDEELLIQVSGIINGFKEMWRLLAICHRKQFRTIGRSKSCIHIVEKGSSSRKATHRVEEHIRRYKESLRCYIDAQRGFVELLNEWLNRNIMKDDETNEIESPAIFKVCSEWRREIVSVDEAKLLSAVEEMELRFRGLGFKQTEEEKHRTRRARLSKELERKKKELEEILEARLGPTPLEQEVLCLREIETQEKEKHARLLRELNDTVSTSLQECLVPVFEALEVFCFDNFKAYLNIRTVSG